MIPTQIRSTNRSSLSLSLAMSSGRWLEMLDRLKGAGAPCSSPAWMTWER
jgi:hypothetical protein